MCLIYSHARATLRQLEPNYNFSQQKDNFMKNIQTSYMAGLEYTISGRVKAHIVLRDDVAMRLVRLAHSLNKPMTKIVTEALDKHLEVVKAETPLQPVLL